MLIKPYRKQKRKKNEQNKTKNKLYLLKGSHLKHGAAGTLKKLVTACLSSSLPVSHTELRFSSGRDALLLTPAHSLKKRGNNNEYDDDGSNKNKSNNNNNNYDSDNDDDQGNDK